MFFMWWFRDRGRKIFRYHDGTSYVRRDPIEIGEAIERVCPDYLALIDTLAESDNEVPPGPLRDSIVEQQEGAIAKLESAARSVFELAHLGKKRGGVTRGEAIAILCRYVNYMRELSRGARLFTDSPQVG
jgi:hypothetical protein